MVRPRLSGLRLQYTVDQKIGFVWGVNGEAAIERIETVAGGAYAFGQRGNV